MVILGSSTVETHDKAWHGNLFENFECVLVNVFIYSYSISAIHDDIDDHKSGSN